MDHAEKIRALFVLAGNSAHSILGENINHVISGGNDNINPVSGQAIIHGHSVELRKVS